MLLSLQRLHVPNASLLPGLQQQEEMERGTVGDACTRALGAMAEDVAAGLGLSILGKIWGFLTDSQSIYKAPGARCPCCRFSAAVMLQCRLMTREHRCAPFLGTMCIAPQSSMSLTESPTVTHANIAIHGLNPTKNSYKQCK